MIVTNGGESPSINAGFLKSLKSSSLSEDITALNSLFESNDVFLVPASLKAFLSRTETLDRGISLHATVCKLWNISYK